jgi:DNA repair exonuclease SbcCD ATPase subunit
MANLTAEDITAVRRQLGESQNLMRETVDRLRLSQEENEMIMRRRDELEERVSALEAEYEELLEKTIHDEETSNVDVGESMAELKVRSGCCDQGAFLIFRCRTSLRHNTRPSARHTLARCTT